MANNGRETPKNQPIPKKTPNAPRRPRPRRTPSSNNVATAFETPPRPVRRSPPVNTPRATARRRLNFNNANFMRFLNQVLLNTPVAPKTPAPKTPMRSKKNKSKK
jgi:hypothetical protein